MRRGCIDFLSRVVWLAPNVYFLPTTGSPPTTGREESILMFSMLQPATPNSPLSITHSSTTLGRHFRPETPICTSFVGPLVDPHYGQHGAGIRAVSSFVSRHRAGARGACAYFCFLLLAPFCKNAGVESKRARSPCVSHRKDIGIAASGHPPSSSL